MTKTTFPKNKTLIRSLLLGAATIIVGIFLSKILGKKSDANIPSISFQTKSVVVSPAMAATIPLKIVVNGRLTAAKRMQIISEVNGVLLNANFKKGNNFSQGQIIANLDGREFEAQLKSQKSAYMAMVSQVLADVSTDYPTQSQVWNSFLSAIDPNKKMPPLPKVEDAALNQLLVARNIYTNYYNIEAQQIRLNKYQIITPFSGVLSETSADPGTLVRANQPIGVFIQASDYELEASLAPNDLRFLKIGSKVSLFSPDFNKNFTGTLTRINSVIDTRTQLVSVFLSVNGKELSEGMFLEATVDAGSVNNAMKVKRNIIIENQYLYSVSSDSSISKSPIEIQSYDGEYAIITSKAPFNNYVSQPYNGLFEGLKVKPLYTEKSGK